MEAEAKLGIQKMILEGSVQLAWSYILDFENEMNPFAQRKVVVSKWRMRATCDTGETNEFLAKAQNLVQQGIKSKDALHLACAIALECDYFLTTDDNLIKKSIRIEEIRVADPITFVREELE